MAKKPAKPARKSPAKAKARSRRRSSGRARRRGRLPARPRGQEARRARQARARRARSPPPRRSRTGREEEGRAPRRSRREAAPKAKPAPKRRPRRRRSRRQARQARQGKPPKPSRRQAGAKPSRPGRRRGRASAAARPPPRRRTSRPPSEIAAKIAGKRAEDAASKKGRNGRHAEIAPRELTPADVEARKRRLKTLIVLGKERGFLTYAEINDHLPDDVLDAEQIEGIVSMIGDMGIQVYDEAPDAETLLMAERRADRAGRGRRGRSRSRGVDARLRIRPHHRPGAHVHARDGLGRAPDARRRDRDRQADRGRPEAHDHGDLGLPDDGRADPRSRRPRSRRTSSRSTTSSTASWTSTRQLDAIEDVDDDVEDERGRRPTPARSPRENLERLKVAALERFATIRKLFARMLVGAAEGRPQGAEVPRAAEEDQRRADADPLLGAPGREAVRQRAHRGRQHPPDRAQDPGPRREQGRHAAPGLHQEVPGQRDVAALDRPRGRPRITTTASSSPSTGRRSSSSSRSCSTCRRA